MPITVRLPDDSTRELADGATGADLAGGIGARLLEAALAVKVNGQMRDLNAPLPDGAQVAIMTSKDPDSLDIIRHSTAHMLAQAVRRLFPEAKVGIGPTIEDGFYYDFLVEKFFTPEDLTAIEIEMRSLADSNVLFVREELSREEAILRFEQLGEPLKVELATEIPAGEVITGYRQGEFYDLCRGPHVPSTS